MVPLKYAVIEYGPGGTIGVLPRAATPEVSVVTLLTNPWPAADREPLATKVTVRPVTGEAPAFRVAETPLGSPGSAPLPTAKVRLVASLLTVNGAWSLLPAFVGSP